MPLREPLQEFMSRPAVGALLARIKSLLMTPAAEWDKIEAEETSFPDLFRNYAMLLAAVPAVAGFLGSFLFGTSFFGGHVEMQPFAVVIAAAFKSYIFNLGGVAALGMFIVFLAPRYGGSPNQKNAFKLAVYSATPAWLSGVFLLLPPLAPMTVAGLYGIWLLYIGAPRLMKTPPETSGIFTVMVSLAAFLCVAVAALAIRL